jgi:hypothetical protein
LTIGASVKRIGKRAFRMCNVGEITCKSPAFEVDDEAFYNNTGLDTGEWLSHITKLGKRVFFMCRFWKAPNFENLEEIGSEAFYTCFFGGNNAYGSRTGDCTFIIPPKLKSIATDAFSNCVYLSWFYVKDNPYFHGSEQKQPYLLNSSGTSLLMTVPDPFNSPMGEDWYTFPETLVKLEPGCIRDRGNIVIPKSVVEMEGAFKDCSRYTEDVYIRADIPPSSLTRHSMKRFSRSETSRYMCPRVVVNFMPMRLAGDVSDGLMRHIVGLVIILTTTNLRRQAVSIIW